MKKLQNMKGITLIALVITIVVLLILAGVTIAMLTGDNGILTKAQTSKTKSAEEEAKEKVNLMMADWKMEYTINNAPVLDEFLKLDTYRSNREGYKVEGVEGPENSKYIAIVNVGSEQYEVTINAEDEKNPYIESVDKKGTRLSIISSISGYKFVGDADGLQVTINATAPDGDLISSIESMNDLTNISISTLEQQNVVGVYKVIANNSETGYKFKITLKSGDTKEVTVTVNNFLSAPELPAYAISGTVDTIEIDLNKITQYPATAGVKYKYCYSTTSGSGYTETIDNPIKNLTAGTTYYLKLKAYLENDETKYLYSTQEQSYELKFGEYIPIENIKDIEYLINNGYGDVNTLFDRDLSTGCAIHHDHGESTVVVSFNKPQTISCVSSLLNTDLYNTGCNMKVYGYKDEKLENEINIGEVYTGMPWGGKARATVTSSRDLFYAIKIVLFPDDNWQGVSEIEIFR